MSKILKFSAGWCTPCKALSWNIGALTPEEQAKFEEYDVDAPGSKELVTQYGLRSVPTMVLLDDKGSIIKIVSGVQTIPKLRELIALL
jgi:thioredoxin 1